MRSMERPLILVDDNDRVLGHASKLKCHSGTGKRHRAYLVMIINPRGELLLARRSPLKSLWPGWWDGTVAGHVEKGETYLSAARRRTYEEIGIRPPLRRTDVFTYEASWEKNGENEMCAIFVAKASTVFADPREIDRMKWVKKPLDSRKLVPWLRITLERR